MEEQALDLKDYLDAFKRRRSTILSIAAGIFLIGLLAALLWPPTYRSSATILIKEQDIPPELVTSTVTSFASQRIQTISQLVMARSNLLEIIEKYDLYKNERKRLTTEEILREMRNNIELNMIDAQVVDPRSGRPTAATIAFGLGFSGDNPRQVQKVTNELTSLYLNENLKDRSAKASETYAFLSAEADRLNKEISKFETKLTVFKEKNAQSLPDLNQLNLQMLERVDKEIDDVNTQLSSLEERRIFMRSQLDQVKPFGSDISVDPSMRLQALRNQYYTLIARYSENHPDVMRAKREMEGLETETGSVSSAASQLQKIEVLKGELAVLKKRYSDEHPDVIKLEKQIESIRTSANTAPSPLARSAKINPDNPAYISLTSQLQAINSEVSSLRNKKLMLQNKIEDYEGRLAKTPQIEGEYRALVRNLNTSTTQYQEITAKKLQAEIAQQLETERKGERFVLIEPAILPEEPVSPNRPAIIFLSLVLALGAGIGYAAIAESMDDAIRGSKSLIAAVGAGPLAEIPYLQNAAEITGRKRKFAAGTLAMVSALILAIALTHFFWKPLDVLWYKALRKADVVINT